MKSFFEATAWTMTTPKPYGSFHILFFVIGLIVSIVLAILLRKTNDKQNKIVLGVCGGLMILAELYKQLFYYYVIGNNNYPLWIIPLQLCSIPMYLCVACVFIKSEKFKSWIYNFIFSVNMFGGLISFAEPSGLNHSYLTLTLHAYTWHMMLIFIGLYLFLSKRACKNWKDFFKGVAVFGVFSVIVQIINVALKGKGGLNLFYISPYVQSPIVFFNDFYSNYGWVANMFLYLFALLLGCAISFYAFYFARKIVKKIKTNKINEADVEI